MMPAGQMHASSRVKALRPKPIRARSKLARMEMANAEALPNRDARTFQNAGRYMAPYCPEDTASPPIAPVGTHG